MSLTQEQVVRLAPGGANFRQWYTALKAEIYKDGGRRYLLATDRLEIPDYDLDRDLYYASLIGSLVDDTQLKYVEVSRADEQHPTRVFTNYALLGLRNVCAGTLADRMALRGELGAFAWDEATDYDTNAGRFQRLLARLEAANDTTSEADRILDFLHRVPHRFFTTEVNAILTALTYDPERYQTLDSVVQQIREYAKRESQANGRASSTAAQHGNAAFQTSSEPRATLHATVATSRRTSSEASSKKLVYHATALRGHVRAAELVETQPTKLVVSQPRSFLPMKRHTTARSRQPPAS
ncbi:hypothetical protein SPRG_02786 [Saprolegnia parasitica CBS 223.65]|uniref:Uncharacterized protein n=1 Tax=Saprolegnia parasitica (strain CBS 223.65) TaxID=695850 RepID=A0A067CZT4_SAPPC|nr:hypothetical protein SPRG_02786 [Saprolegnia parasitica CBS 223.65]KDO32307.1 hypothetical protein SPRG_02786 [Saprolegnia parasitica CBS 223.65]|eukprot:XP_012196763.1 hypothetical protein SPRG_02786 [Saprolegnia parasitica CBS 223.65]